MTYSESQHSLLLIPEPQSNILSSDSLDSSVLFSSLLASLFGAALLAVLLVALLAVLLDLEAVLARLLAAISHDLQFKFVS